MGTQSHKHADEGGWRGRALDQLIERAEAEHSETEPWKCESCGCLNVDTMSPGCQNCGRDFLGRSDETTIPPMLERDVRPGLRSDVYLDNTGYDGV